MVQKKPPDFQLTQWGLSMLQHINRVLCFAPNPPVQCSVRETKWNSIIIAAHRPWQINCRAQATICEALAVHWAGEGFGPRLNYSSGAGADPSRKASLRPNPSLHRCATNPPSQILTHLPTHLLTHPDTYSPTHLQTHLPSYPDTFLPTNLPTCLPTYTPTFGSSLNYSRPVTQSLF